MIYQYTLQTNKNTNINLADYTDQILLIVNTASECGFTYQYEELEQLHRLYQSQGLVVLGFPSNDFGGQEPGTDQEILEFCQTEYKVTFSLSEKTVLSNNLLFQELAQITGQTPTWNFNKYLVAPGASKVLYFASDADPQGPIEDAVKLIINEYSR